jgi:hypothetical protein
MLDSSKLDSEPTSTPFAELGVARSVNPSPFVAVHPEQVDLIVTDQGDLEDDADFRTNVDEFLEVTEQHGVPVLLATKQSE